MINLNAKTLAAQKKHATNHPAWLDEQLHVKRYRVAATSLCGGKSLKELNLHRRYNVFVLEIQNGSQILPIPQRQCRYLCRLSAAFNRYAQTAAEF